MTKTTETVSIESVVPGTVLAAPVVDDGGRVLVPAGTALTEASLNSLKRREIETLTVEHEVELDPAELEARRVRAEAQLQRLFRHAGESVDTKTLYQTILNYRLETAQ